MTAEASAMMRRREGPLLKNGIFHASWKARTLRRNGWCVRRHHGAHRRQGHPNGQFGTSGHRGSQLNGTFTEAHVFSPTVQATCDYRCASGPIVRCTRERYPRCFAAGAADEARRELEAWQNRCSCSIGRKKQCSRIHNFTASGGALLVVAVPCRDSLRIEEEQ